jgi:hypothetical protein
MSTWTMSAPAATMARVSSPSFEKSADRIEGQIFSGRMASLGLSARDTTSPPRRPFEALARRGEDR